MNFGEGDILNAGVRMLMVIWNMTLIFGVLRAG